MEEEQSKIGEVTEKVREYIVTTSELIELKAVDKLAIISSEIISGLVIGLVTVLFVLFISLAAGFYLSTVLGDRFSGFFIVAGFYLIVGIISIVMRKQLLSRPTANRIVRKIFEENKY